MATEDQAFPFARELLEQHDALRTTARWIEAEVDRLRNSDHREGFLLVPLRAFAHELGQHFAFEERHAFGLSPSQGAAPLPAGHQTPGPLQTFVQEHRSFERRLASILARLAVHQALDSLVPGDLLVDLHDLFENLRAHEVREAAFASRDVPVLDRRPGGR